MVTITGDITTDQNCRFPRYCTPRLTLRAFWTLEPSFGHEVTMATVSITATVFTVTRGEEVGGGGGGMGGGRECGRGDRLPTLQNAQRRVVAYLLKSTAYWFPLKYGCVRLMDMGTARKEARFGIGLFLRCPRRCKQFVKWHLPRVYLRCCTMHVADLSNLPSCQVIAWNIANPSETKWKESSSWSTFVLAS